MTGQTAAPAFAAILLVAVLAGCNEGPSANALPVPQEVSDSAVAEFCGMALSEHPGPKGQIFIKGLPGHPYWFASVHNTIAFTMLPEAPKDIAAIYVNDMGKAKNWAHPEPGTWIEARKALFVIESRKRGGMGENEVVPFSDSDAAQLFIGENGGKLVHFDELPKDSILGSGERPLTATRYDPADFSGETGDQTRSPPDADTNATAYR